jgi:hypothetical protein
VSIKYWKWQELTVFAGQFRRACVVGLFRAAVREEVKMVEPGKSASMIRTIAIAVFALALASAAQAMPFAPLHQPDPMITQARMGCGAGYGYGQRRLRG